MNATEVKKVSVLESTVQREFDAKETMQWLKVNLIWVMSWGAKKFTTFDSKALFFTVSGNLHKGIVLITLAWDDTYTIHLLSSRWSVKKVIENVYCDELAEVIDNNIENVYCDE